VIYGSPGFQPVSSGIPAGRAAVLAARCGERRARCPRSRARIAAFTIIELLVVMAVILVLAALILGTSGYVQKKGARSRAEAEIAAMSAALESYKADNGIYPRDTNGTTDNLNARTNGDASTYATASLFLFTQLSGTDATQQPIPGAKNYFSFKPQMLGGTRDANGNVTSVSFVRDPFGNSYAYSTAYQANTSNGYNPTFDLWSTGGSSTTANPPTQTEWIKNW
jgi:general secretion pathway protein G